MRHRNRFVGSLLTVGWLVLLPVGTAAAPKSKPVVDRYGDPLPTGAEMRLGTTRLRHGGTVNGVAFSPDGKSLVSLAWTHQIRIWDVKTARQRRKLTGVQNESFFAAAYSPDGALLACVGERGLVHLFATDTGEELIRKAVHEDRVFGVAFAPDGNTFASAGGDGNIVIWDVATGKQKRSFKAAGRVYDSHPVAFSPDGAWLASGARGVVNLWALTKANKNQSIQTEGRRAIYSLHFTPDGKSLISSGYHYKTQKLPDGTRVGRSVGSLDAWDVKTRKKLRSFRDGKSPLTGGSTALSKDGKTLASVHRDRICIWDPKTGKLRRSIREYSNAYIARTHGAALSPDGKIVAVRGSGGTVLMWDTITGKRLHPFPDGHEDRTSDVAVSPDGKFIASSAADATVCIWGSSNGKMIRKLRFGRKPPAAANSLAWSPDGKLLAAGGYDRNPRRFGGMLMVWDARTGEKKMSVAMTGRVQCVAFSPDGKSLAVAEGLGLSGLRDIVAKPVITIREATSGKILASVKGETARNRWMRFTTDGKQLMAADERGAVRLCDAGTGKVVKQWTIEGHGRPDLWSAAFSPDLKSIASGSAFSETVFLQPADGGKGTRKLKTGKVYAIAYSPDGRFLATSALGEWIKTKRAANVIQIWNLKTGKIVQRLKHGSKRASYLEFTPDGKRLVSGLNDGTVLLWDTSSTAKR